MSNVDITAVAEDNVNEVWVDEASKAYLEFANNGSKGSCSMFNDDGLERYSKIRPLKYQNEMVRDCLNIAISECKYSKNELIESHINKALKLLQKYGL